jgi:uncharacterized membrane protein
MMNKLQVFNMASVFALLVVAVNIVMFYGMFKLNVHGSLAGIIVAVFDLIVAVPIANFIQMKSK